ncbi:hypothetical protein [Natrarchaeobaculum sulfurireducens]|uniref:Uncharacterized protein n=1 Tax=Natrarchaeobaculum sulfurireducens TaxID=2044521 RepID=A0A346P9E1_9EURY|nr:hypothetical protein [Natrarchaeobaculum sulfurireducens]AXR76136.1 hypothetical protein AArc1_4019 [Natrarchaeobaculum sulfurireducens]
MSAAPVKPDPPELPAYVLDPLESQSPKRLELIAEYAANLATWKRAKQRHELEQKRDEDEIEEGELKNLEDREISTDPKDYEKVPTGGAYITIKETKPGYQYYYWQWRDGESWKNEYIAPVNPK